ncbi:MULTISPECIES: 30S ribosomal protein S13 [Methanocorpusculum]|jgi:small subunit ribosomal protein S13|uniref:Small ribosomal subunit protein uS13 n=1 Tax=Methanocorpusculum parvum TaxID=2193 RepID=A0AAX0Q8L5_9EURY|nr:MULTISPECIES: 30S ribosomal protein S13 [Methanocorpusculum]MDD2248889.1 30S ribosomal protein S13 [Methanocorpusculum sp.]MDD2803862.1 30S ribosomal protein S13 [Methanocorpusculum sp.]MDD3047673.1 30S ribosomal protein S13 [Methanocorpusculum sp.]MDD3912770.1 30S ribosomal protein S13 [Methanocorpusculum sp.]MDD4423995.1 30S ribosomal protein S13 [Methanocorpusculum parvum]
MVEESELKYFVRIINTDLDGTQPVQLALTGIKGIGLHAALVIARRAGVDVRATMGLLGDDDVAAIEEQVKAYPASVPKWMVNRPVDVYSGEPKHLYGSDLSLAKDDDINLMKKMRCYRGIRHENGLKVRGQRTKATGRFGKIVGVSKRRN